MKAKTKSILIVLFAVLIGTLVFIFSIEQEQNLLIKFWNWVLNLFR